MNRKITLSESEIPSHWYNIVADMPNKPFPPLNPGTGEPIGPEALAPLFPMSLIMQEVSQDQFIEIPEDVRDVYAMWRPTPMSAPTILFNMCGHGNFDMLAYQDYFACNLARHELSQQEVDNALAKIETPTIESVKDMLKG